MKVRRDKYDAVIVGINSNQISAVNGIMTTFPASLVPESRDWQVVNRPPTQKHDHGLANIDVPQKSSFPNKLTARGAKCYRDRNLC